MIERGDVTILGGGLTGLLLSVMLAAHGFRPRVYERYADPRKGLPLEGRSINLALAERGRRALAKAGILGKVMRHATPMPGRALHQANGELAFQAYGQRSEECIYSIERVVLNVLLMDAAEALGVDIRFEQHCVDVDAARHRAVVEHTPSGRREAISMRPLIAADGAGSIIRRHMNERAQFGASERLLDHGYKELTIPPTAYGAYRMSPQALHVWPRGGFMLIALPNPGGDFTATLFLPMDGDPGFRQLDGPAAARKLFETHFPDALALMPTFDDDFAAHPVGIMGTVRCRRWHDGGRVLLIGDAAHAIVPFHGQGMNACFEDCYVFDELLAADPPDWCSLFAAFQDAQRDNANAIADMALENYVEMRDTVRDPAFHLRKALAFELERRAGDYFVPRYSMVMFHPEISYAEAQRRGAVQAAILDEFTRGAATLDDVDTDAALAATRSRLSRLTLPQAELPAAAPA